MQDFTSIKYISGATGSRSLPYTNLILKIYWVENIVLAQRQSVVKLLSCFMRIINFKLCEVKLTS